MRSIGALFRAAYLSAASYRVGIVISFVGLLSAFIPLYFISRAVQPVVAESIRLEGGQYFGFVVVGIGATFIMSAAVGAIPGALSGSIASGTLEALLVTRTPLYQVLIGMSSYGLLWSGARAALLFIGAAAMGVPVSWSAVPVSLAIVALLVVAYASLGLVAAALVLVFRTAGPFSTGVMTASGLLGGVYYSTSVIPSWLQDLSGLIPLTYALRAMRMLLLGGASYAEALPDIAKLVVFTGLLAAGASIVFASAFRRARVAGTLSQY